MQLTVVIPGRPPNPNDYNRSGSGAQHWAQQRAVAKRWRTAAARLGQAAKPPGWVALGRARLVVTFVVATRARRDLDNLVSSTKPLTDGLVDAGLLVDDSTNVLTEVVYRWRYQKGVNATEYVIEGDTDTLQW